jgi:hypothetical protein
MLPAKDELQQYADSARAALPCFVRPHYAALIAQTIKSMTPDQAEAWMALIQAAEQIGGEYDYSRTDENADEAQLN